MYTLISLYIAFESMNEFFLLMWSCRNGDGARRLRSIDFKTIAIRLFRFFSVTLLDWGSLDLL